MLILESWCQNCSPWLIPLLLLSWALGWLLWDSWKGSGLKDTIKGLQEDVTGLRNQKAEVETDLAKSNYELEKVNSEKVTLFNQNKAWEGKYNQLTESATSQEDIDAYQSKIANLESKIQSYESTNIQLESEFKGLKRRYSDIETQLASAGAASADTENLNAQIDDLKQQLEASHAANTKLHTEFSSLQTNYEDTASKLQIAASNTANVEDYNNRISDMELQLSIVRNANAELEANYAKLKSEFGEMELSLQEARNAKPDVSAYDARIEELKLLLNEKETKNEKLAKDYKKLKKKYDDSTIVPLVKVEKPKKKPAKLVVVIKEDDLTKIEGIGPKIESLLKDAGIKTWKQLSKTPTPKLSKILDDAGSRYKMHNPGTWAQQAEMAAAGKWDELKEWQDKLDGGR